MRAARLARLHNATDRQAGERVRIRPQTGGGYTAAGPDAARPSLVVIAYVARVPGAVRTSGNAANSGHNVQLRASADTIKFATSELPYTVQADDLVDLIEQPGTPTVRVARVAAFGTDRTVLFVIPAV